MLVFHKKSESVVNVGPGHPGRASVLPAAMVSLQFDLALQPNAHAVTRGMRLVQIPAPLLMVRLRGSCREALSPQSRFILDEQGRASWGWRRCEALECRAGFHHDMQPQPQP